MKLIDGIKNSGSPYQIPDCSRNELPEFFKEMGYRVGAEIGVYKGQFTERFCREELKIHAIDNWAIYKTTGIPIKGQQSQERQDVLYEMTKKRLAPYDCNVIRKDSMDAAQDFPNESLDFVYIDGDHSFPGIANDIYEWFFRVRSGGIISGDDYMYTGNHRYTNKFFTTHCGVPSVVNAFVELHRIGNFYTFGRSLPLEEEENRDLWLSWMFIKP